MTTPRDERSLARLVREDRRATAKSLARKWSAIIQKKVSERTVRRQVHLLGYNGRHACKKPKISGKNAN